MLCALCCAQLTKRNIGIRDDSGSSIDITLWGAAVANPGDMLEEVRPSTGPTLCPCALRSWQIQMLDSNPHFLARAPGNAQG